MELSSVKRVAYVVNTIILLIVLGLMSFFAFIHTGFLVLFSIPTICVYLLGYYLIKKDKLDIYVWLIYFWISLYMCLTTICLGYGYRFHLYCFSMIPIMFITEYLAFKLQRRSIKALPVSISIAIIYIISTGYVACFGPVYKRGQIISAFFWIINAIIVFSFLIYYTYYLINIIVLSEKKLQKAAFIDQLTQMYNRHYMYDKLVKITSDNKSCVIAIIDIDNFKIINDTYGHNAGDEVLKRISDYIREECKDFEISRWGGEEFLIISYKSIEETIQSFERLRTRIASSPVHYNDKDINVTITVGLSLRKTGQNLDDLIEQADNRLYYGKNHGKNCIITNIEE